MGILIQDLENIKDLDSPYSFETFLTLILNQTSLADLGGLKDQNIWISHELYTLIFEDIIQEQAPRFSEMSPKRLASIFGVNVKTSHLLKNTQYIFK